MAPSTPGAPAAAGRVISGTPAAASQPRATGSHAQKQQQQQRRHEDSESGAGGCPAEAASGCDGGGGAAGGEGGEGTEVNEAGEADRTLAQRMPGAEWRERCGPCGIPADDRRSSPIVELSLLLVGRPALWA